ncbi:amidohydrolase [Candidatus Woesearchaeota archaeon]|nr:amidohydrolase [Candidatus Woesearchaeota archaeon]MBW3006097.1 amidohydrolase [Candidatus Woesearchaeota archaeon]
MKIFDAHSHIGKFGMQHMKERDVAPFQDREITNAEEQKAYMKRNKITKAIVMPHYVPDQKVPFEVYNLIVLDVISKLDNVYGALWVSPLPENREYTKKVLDSLPIDKIKALKLSADSWPKGIGQNPATWDEKFKESMDLILAACRKHDLVLHVHTGSGDSDFKTQIYPFIEYAGKKIKLQIVHMGSSAGGIFAFVPRFIDLLKEGYDIYCDTSFARTFGPTWLIKELEKKYPEGLNRVLFGSDNPWGLFPCELCKITEIDCSDEIKNKILYENASALYGGAK